MVIFRGASQYLVAAAAFATFNLSCTLKHSSTLIKPEEQGEEVFLLQPGGVTPGVKMLVGWKGEITNVNPVFHP